MKTNKKPKKKGEGTATEKYLTDERTYITAGFGLFLLRATIAAAVVHHLVVLLGRMMGRSGRCRQTGPIFTQ